MTIHQMRIFSVTARHLNVTKAAYELHISQPALSHHLKLLQEEVRLTLYRKVGSGIQLTRRGKLFLAEVEPVLSEMERITNKFRSKSRSLTVGGSDAPAACFLPLLGARFTETHPRTEVTLRVNSSSTMEEMVQKSEVDIAVITNPSGLFYLEYERCRREELIFFASASHQLAGTHATLTELSQAHLILFKRGKIGGMAETLNRIEERGIRLRIAMRCESVEAVKNVVKEGKHLGLLYKDNLQSEIDRGELKEVRIPGLELYVDSFVVYRKQKPLSDDAKDFLALLRGSQTAQAKKPLEACFPRRPRPALSPELFQEEAVV